MRLLLLLLVIVSNATLFAQAKHPFTFEDMMKLKRVEEPEVSPDGKWVLFAAVDVDLAANTKTPHVWLVPTAGGVEKEIIAGQDAERPRWAPDGKRFAFISTKESGSQVWIADFADGSVAGVHKLTSIATEADGELWSPDGKNILFRSDIYPECDGTPAEEQTCNAKKLDEVRNSKVKAQIFTHLLYRHWNAYKEGRRSHLFVVASPAPSTYRTDNSGRRYDNLGYAPLPAVPRDLTPGDYDAPVFSLGGQDNYAFSPDGQEICYASNHDKMEAASTNNDLWIVPVNRWTAAPPTQPKNITADNPAADNTPLYSPDGKYIAYRAQQRPGYESDRWRLMLYDRKTGERKSLTDNFDRWAESFTWTPDGKWIYFAAENKGNSLLFRTDVKGSSPSVLAPCNPWHAGGAYGDPQFSSDGRTLLATRSTLRQPSEIYAFDTMAFGARENGRTTVCVQTNTPMIKVQSELEGEFERNHGLGHIGTLEVDSRQVTNLSAELRTSFYDLGIEGIDDFWFRGANGDPVQGFIVRPPGMGLDAGKKYPVKFLIHGGPEGSWGDDWSYRWNAELFAANGYVVIMINFHGSTGYGQKFIDAINGDWGGAPFEDLMKGLDYAEQHYSFIDKNRECALGASYGGYMIDWILGHTNRFKCLVSHDGQFNTTSTWGTTEELWFQEWEFKGTPYTNRAMYDKWSPHLYAANFKTPTLVIHSQRDYRLDVSEGFQLFTTLQRQGVPSKMLYFPDEGHWILKPQNSQLWYKTVNDWVDQWIGK